MMWTIPSGIWVYLVSDLVELFIDIFRAIIYFGAIGDTFSFVFVDLSTDVNSGCLIWALEAN